MRQKLGMMIVTLAVAVTPISADIPAHYFCGGAIEYSSRSWFQRSEPQGSRSGTIELEKPPVKCPQFSAMWRVAGGLGDTAAIPSIIPGNGTLDTSTSLYYSVTPQTPFGNLGILGTMMGRIFGGPAYGYSGRSAAEDIATIKTMSAKMVGVLDSDTAYVQSQIPIIRQQVQADTASLQTRVLAFRSQISAEQMTTRAALNARGPQNVPYPPGRLDSLLVSLQTAQQIAAIEAAIPREHLRPSGGSVLNSLDSVRANVYGDKPEVEQRIEYENSKIRAAVATSSGASQSAQVLLSYAQNSTAAAQRFALSRSNASSEVANHLVQESQSCRYASRGLIKVVMVATIQPDGSLADVPWTPGKQFPANAVRSDLARFDSAAATAAAALDAGAIIVAGLPEAQRSDGIELVREGRSLQSDAQAAYLNGRFDEGWLLQCGALEIGSLAKAPQAYNDSLAEPDASELSEFTKALGEETLSAAEAKAGGELGRIVTGMEELEGPIGITKDFAEFNAALVKYLSNPTPELAATIENYGIKFGLTTTGATLAGALAVAAELSGGWVFTAGVAAGVAAEYATKALISYSRQQHQKKPIP